MSIVFPFLLLIACSSETNRPIDPPAQVAVDSSTDERGRLSPEQLAAYFPEQVGTFHPVPDSYRGEEVADLEDDTHVMSVATIDYQSPFNTSRGSGSYDVRIRIDDWIDWPSLADNMVAAFDRLGEGVSEQWDGMQTQSRLADGTLVIEKVKKGDFAELKREMLIDGRFKVTMTAKRNTHSDFDADALRAILVETYASSRLAELAEAPVYADSSPSGGLPGWLGGEADTQPPSTDSCDALLPIAEVERICGVSDVRAVYTGMSSSGDCNLMFKRGEAAAGFIFLLSRHGQSETARRALAVASDTDNETKRIPGLGDGGFSFVNQNGEARVVFTVGSVLVELKASDSPMDGADEKLCLQQHQVEEIAQGVADRLTD